MPLFIMPMSAIEIYPTNTLLSIDNWLLVSYLYRWSEVDAYLFHEKGEGSRECKLEEKSEWGFRKDDMAIVYQRHKSKKHRQLNMKLKSERGITTANISPNMIEENKIDLGSLEPALTLAQLLQLARQVLITTPEL